MVYCNNCNNYIDSEYEYKEILMQAKDEIKDFVSKFEDILNENISSREKVKELRKFIEKYGSDAEDIIEEGLRQING